MANLKIPNHHLWWWLGILSLRGQVAALLQQDNVIATASANLNLRAGPSTSSKVLGLVKRNTTMPVLGRDSASRWIFVEAGNKRGWIAAWMVTVQGNLAAVPITDQVGGLVPLICPVPPAGGFLTVWQGDLALQISLGCPTPYHPRIQPDAWEIQTAYQPFQRGMMIWSNRLGWQEHPVIYVIYANSTYKRFDDTFDVTVDPISGGAKPPFGLEEPVMGFGKIWRTQPGVRKALGWATASETPGVGRFQMFIGTDVGG
jgi:hypothetical protein